MHTYADRRLYHQSRALKAFLFVETQGGHDAALGSLTLGSLVAS